jgi:hypothetical protein
MGLIFGFQVLIERKEENGEGDRSKRNIFLIEKKNSLNMVERDLSKYFHTETDEGTYLGVQAL